MPLRASVVVPCRAVTSELRQCLDALLRVRPPPEEIIVFPDGSISDTFPRTRFVPTGPLSPAEKRDRVLAEGPGDILAFLDDDAYPRPDWLAQALRHFTDPTVAAVGGPAVTAGNDGFWAQLSGAVFSSWLGSGPLRMRYRPTGAVRTVDDWPSVNLLVRRDAFAAVGGFDTSFWPGEDTKLCLDLIQAGWRIVYDPSVVVSHHRATTPLKHLRQVARYGLHRGYFAKRFPATSRRWFYALPLLFGALAVGGTVAAALSARMRPAVVFIAAVLVASALLGGIVEAWRARRIALLPFFPILLVLHHGAYGLSYLRGLTARNLKHYERVRR